MSVYIIAEVGINHNGELSLAKELIKTAKNAGADCVKFQTFKADEFIADKSETYTYTSQGKEITESMYEMFKRFEFTKAEWIEIIEFCKKCHIDFSSTAQNISDLDFLMSLAELPFIKVGSDDLTNLSLLREYASRGIPMVISAGMAYAYEIEDAVRTIRQFENSKLTVLHCVSSYPAQSSEVNLLKMKTIQRAFGVDIGFSDHTLGSSAAVGAVCLGAKVIEKHFTLSCNMAGPDHWFSADKDQLFDYVNNIRFAEKILGEASLGPTKKEIEMRKIARRKIVFAKNITKGECLKVSDIAFKRCNDDAGFAPKNIDFFLGRKLTKDCIENEAVKTECFL